MARFEISPGVMYLDRSEWKPNPDLPRLGRFVPRKDRTQIIIHHTVCEDNDETPNRWETEDEVIKKMQRLQTIRPDLGLDVPYNFIVFLMNSDPASIIVCEGRGEDRLGAHTEGHNTPAIGIALQGNFQAHAIDVRPYARHISKFLGWLKFDANGPNYGGPYEPLKNLGSSTPEDRLVWCHRDFKNTDCPGKHIFSILPQLNFLQ